MFLSVQTLYHKERRNGQNKISKPKRKKRKIMLAETAINKSNGQEVVSRKDARPIITVSFIEIVKGWKNIPGTLQHHVTKQKPAKQGSSVNVVCILDGPAFDAAFLIEGSNARIKNSIEQLEVVVSVDTLRRKLSETKSWSEARWVTIEAGMHQTLHIKKTSLSAALEKL